MESITTGSVPDSGDGLASTKHVEMTTMSRLGAVEETTSTFHYTTLAPPVLKEKGVWTVHELKILGVVLWLVIIITLIGNLACFYAVIRNMKVLF
jgi:hypothetical protein